MGFYTIKETLGFLPRLVAAPGEMSSVKEDHAGFCGFLKKFGGLC
jgi:hypothetical protein